MTIIKGIYASETSLSAEGDAEDVSNAMELLFKLRKVSHISIHLVSCYKLLVCISRLEDLFSVSDTSPGTGSL